MSFRRTGIVASFVVAGAVLLSACGGTDDAKPVPTSENSIGDVLKLHGGSVAGPGSQPDIDNPDEKGAGSQPDIDNPDELPPTDTPDWDAVEKSAPAGGFAAVVVAADSLELSEDGTVSWVAGEIHTADTGPEFVPTDNGLTDSARFASGVEFASPSGCTEPYSDVDLDENGVGLTTCGETDYFNQDTHYLPMIWLDDNGEIVKIADRYHP